MTENQIKWIVWILSAVVELAQVSLKVCLIDTSSEKRLTVHVLLTHKFQERQVWQVWKAFSTSAPIGRGLAAFGEILIFICKTLRARQGCSRCYGIRVSAILLPIIRLVSTFFNWKPHLGPDRSKAYLKNFMFDWEMCFHLCGVYRFQNLVRLELLIKDPFG